MTAFVPTSRSGRRISQVLAAELSCPDESVPKEVTFTENVSIRGARLTTVRRWQPGTRGLVTLHRNGVRSEGRVAYCYRNGSGDFTTGVGLCGQVQRRMENLT